MNNLPVFEKEKIFDILAERKIKTPDKVAYTMINESGKPRSITYAQLHKHACSIALNLTKEGVKCGSRCILLFPQGIEFIETFLACNLLGAIAIPLNMPRRNKSLEKWEIIIEDSESYHICTDEKSVDYLKGILSKSATMNKMILCPVKYHEERFENQNKGLHKELAFLQYTSGSTGMPKGVMVTNDSLLRNIDAFSHMFEFNGQCTFVSWLPYYHDMGLILGILSGIYNGYHVVLMDPLGFVQNPLLWMQSISYYGATHIAAPNFAYELITNKIKKMDVKEIDLSSLKRVICGAEPINVNTMLRFIKEATKFGLGENCLSPGYGLAEATLVVSSYKRSKKVGWIKVDRKELACGRIEIVERGYINCSNSLFKEDDCKYTTLIGNGHVLEGHKIVISDMKGKDVGTLEIGEICYAGSSLTKGYWKKEKETAEAFVYRENQQYLKTGDLGFLDKTGELYITGRIKDLIIIRGTNYYPQDLERTSFTVDKHLRIDGAAAFSEEFDKEDKVVIIQEVEKEGVRNPDCDTWATHIREQILKVHEIMVETIVFVRPMHIPRTTSGKIQRKKAKEKFLTNGFHKVVGISEASLYVQEDRRIDNSQDLLDYIRTMLGTELRRDSQEINEDISFMEMGLNSVMTLRIKEKLEKILKMDISPTIVFNYNTARKLSRKLWENVPD